MTVVSAQANHIPDLGRLWPWMVLVALGGHLLVAAFVFSTPTETSSGGGGRIIGTLSIALGGAAAEQTKPVEEAALEDPVVEDATPVPPDPTKKQARAPAPSKPKPSKPQTRQKNPFKPPLAAETPQPPKPVVQAPQQSARSADTPWDAGPATVASNATPTIGEGAAAKAPGIGGSVNSQAQSYDAYLAMVRSRIESERTYPASARRSGHEGIASVRLVIAANGSLTSAQITQSSGHFALDQAAKRMVQKAAPFPVPPGSTFQVTVPITFALR